MFYVDHFDSRRKLYGVADSDDGVINLVTKEELLDFKQSGINIMSWNQAKQYITSSMNRNCNYHLWRKLVSNCNESDLVEYLKTYSVYTIACKLNELSTSIDFSKRIRLFDYSQINEYFLIVLPLQNQEMLIFRIDSDFECVCIHIPAGFHQETYPSIAGNFIARQLQRQCCDFSGIYPDETYLVFYNSNNTKLLLVNQYRLGSSCIEYKDCKGVL